MYQQYLADPRSVDQAWHDFFADYRPGSPVADGQARAGQPAPAPEPEPAEEPAPAPRAAASPTTQPTNPAPADAEGSATRPSSPAVAPGTTEPASRATPVDARSEGTVVNRAAERTSQQAPAAPAKATAKATAAPRRPAADGEQSGPKRTPLRGAAASVVKNMNASLTVPTATSVRAVPAKLLADNRVVINNHLARARGGKVSFTHLIGYALVRALDDFPNMNNAYAEVDGKPTLVTPEHVNFGLAIDLPKPDGTRSLVVASIKGAEAMDFAGFWGAYEDIIRRART